jgi:prepilin-type N-terminal cleavage/methylation domain-containing protein
MRYTRRNQKGFSMVETLVVVGIICVVSGIAVYQSFGTMESYEANTALDSVIGQLRVARQIAISQRRPVQVTISPVSTDHNLPAVSYTTDVAGAGLAGENTGGYAPNGIAVLPRQTQFMLETNIPDTPMNFGMCGPVCIGGVSGGPTTMYFSPTGQFSQDTAGVIPLNGTIFIGVPGRADTARAITILGGTGRVRPYTFEVSSTTPSFSGHWRE